MRRAVVFGGTLAGIRWALAMKDKGYEVTIISDTTYLGDDLTKTWSSYGAERQGPALERLRQIFGPRTVKFAEVLEPPLLPGKIKRGLLLLVKGAGIDVVFMSYFTGLWVEGNHVAGALLANKFGMQRIKADKVADATLFASACRSIANRPAVVPKGSRMTYQLEYFGVDSQRVKLPAMGAEFFRGTVSPGHAYIQLTRICPGEMELRQAQDYMRVQAAAAAREIHECAGFENAYLAGALPASIDAGIGQAPEIEFIGFERCEPDFQPGDSPGMSGEFAASDDRDEYVVAGRRIPAGICAIAPFGDPFYADTLESITIPLSALELHPGHHDVFIAGGGTAGVWAAVSGAESGLAVYVAEFFGNFGGTRTLGGVLGIYLENARRGIIVSLMEKIRDYAAAMNDGGHSRNSIIASEMLYYHEEFTRLGIGMGTSSVVCAVEMSGGRIARVLCAGQYGLSVHTAGIYLDATGDGDLAVLAGAQTEYGDVEMACTQNYSQWYRASGSCFDSAMPNALDQGVLDGRFLSEWNRAIAYNYADCPDYDIVEMLTVRESRRIRGYERVTMRDYIRGRRYPDAICEAYSDYDPHSRCFSPEGRLGLLPQHAPAQWVEIPLGAMLSPGIGNLLILSKSMSLDQDMYNYTRMNPDVMTLGYIGGLLCRPAIEQRKALRDMDLTALQAYLHILGVLGNMPNSPQETHPEDIARKLADGDEGAFFNAIFSDWKELAPILLRLYQAGECRNDTLALKTLVWFGETQECKKLIDTLDELNTQNGQMIYVDRNTGWLAGNIKGGIIGKIDDYWLMNQLVIILSKACVTAAIDSIVRFIDNTSAGGSPINDDTHYVSGRIDNQCVPNYDRILCIANAVEMMPSSLYVPALDRLLQKPHVTGYCIKQGQEGILNFHMALMELKLAVAAAASGSLQAMDIVNEYTGDTHITLSRYARNKLSLLRSCNKI